MKPFITPNWLAVDAAMWWSNRNAASRGVPQPLTVESAIGVGTYSDKNASAERPITLIVTGISNTMEIEAAQERVREAVEQALIVRGQDVGTQIAKRTLDQQISETEQKLSELRLEDSTPLMNQLVIMRSLAALAQNEKTA